MTQERNRLVTQRAETDLLGVYLNDHLAGSTAGTALIRRLARTYRGQQSGDTLRRMAGEIAADRKALLSIMRNLDVRVRRYKVLGAWLIEKAGRLKLNGSLLARSPVSAVLELEAMCLGVQGKEAGWTALRTIAERDDRLEVNELDKLINRASKQTATLERIRLQTVHELL